MPCYNILSLHTSYEDDIFQVISYLHVQRLKLGGKMVKFGKKTQKHWTPWGSLGLPFLTLQPKLFKPQMVIHWKNCNCFAKWGDLFVFVCLSVCATPLSSLQMLITWLQNNLIVIEININLQHTFAQTKGHYISIYEFQD